MEQARAMTGHPRGVKNVRLFRTDIKGLPRDDRFRHSRMRRTMAFDQPG
jgi:hypothetical protein